jgi:antitoxin Phd
MGERRSQAGSKAIAKAVPKSAPSAALSRRAGIIFDNRKGEEVDLLSFNATEAKNTFGHVLEIVLREGAAVITKHDVPRAVLLSWDEFSALTVSRRTQLDALASDFDALLGRMQTAASRRGMRAAFGASPAALGEAAVKAARKRS